MHTKRIGIAATALLLVWVASGRTKPVNNEQSLTTASINGLEGPAEPRGMTETELGSIQLGKEIPGVGSRRVRMRYVTVEPNGIVAIHSHADRPAMFYVIEGSIHEHRDSRAEPVVLKAGDLSVEAGVTHWWENPGDVPVLLVASDILEDDGQERHHTPVTVSHELAGPGAPVGFGEEVLGRIDLSEELPAFDQRELRSRFVTVEAGGIVPVHPHLDRPALFYVLAGEILEHRSDADEPFVRKAGDFLKAEDGVSHWWENTGDVDVSILVTDVYNTANTASDAG